MAGVEKRTGQPESEYAVASNYIYDVLAMMNVNTTILTQHRLRRTTKVKPVVERLTKERWSSYIKNGLGLE